MHRPTTQDNCWYRRIKKECDGVSETLFGLYNTQADTSMLLAACERGDTEIAKLLIHKRAKVNHCDKVGIQLTLKVLN